MTGPRRTLKTEPRVATDLAEAADLATIAMPYDLYDDRDIQHRVIYVEASRGCPFGCEFCLSSLEVPVLGSILDSNKLQVLKVIRMLMEIGGKEFIDMIHHITVRNQPKRE